VPLGKADKMSALLFRLQLWEEDDIADAFLPRQHHTKPVDADAARWRHAVFEGDEKIFVEFLLFAAGLMLQALALLDGIVSS